MFIKKKNKIQKKYILEAEGGPRTSTLSMYFLSPRYPQCRGFFISKKAPHVFECRADSFIIFCNTICFIEKRIEFFLQKKDLHPKMQVSFLIVPAHSMIVVEAADYQSVVSSTPFSTPIFL